MHTALRRPSRPALRPFRRLSSFSQALAPTGSAPPKTDSRPTVGTFLLRAPDPSPGLPFHAMLVVLLLLVPKR
eukprot:15464411-Alexandrium_andersonii.AAC.1